MLTMEPYITVAQANQFGRTADTASLTTATIRVFRRIRARGYSPPKAVNAELAEIVATVAGRLHSTPDSVAQGVQMEVLGAETTQYGAQAFTAASGLTREEQAAIDSLYPLRPRLHVLGGA